MCVCVWWKCMRVTVIHMHIYITFQLWMCVCVCANHKAHSRYVILRLYVACVRVTPCPTSWQEEPAGYVGNVGPRGVNHRFRLTDELASAALTFTHTLSLSGLHSVTLSGWLSFTPSSCLCLLSISSFLLVSLFFCLSHSPRLYTHMLFFSLWTPLPALPPPPPPPPPFAVTVCLSACLSSFSMTDGCLKAFLFLFSLYRSACPFFGFLVFFKAHYGGHSCMHTFVMNVCQTSVCLNVASWLLLFCCL